jgi:putative PIN family toxin of toxin-antitoxin system
MKIVVDSNIFVSSFFWGGNPRNIFERIINDFDELFITEEILIEIESVMNRSKFQANSSKIKDYIKIIKKYSKIIVSNNISKEISRDEDDNKILQCGIDGNVDFIVTGDNDLLVLNKYKNIKIVKPREYLDIVEKQASHNKQ